MDTLNTLLKEIQGFADAHSFLKGRFIFEAEEQLGNILTEDYQYPVLVGFPTPGFIGENTANFNITFRVLDILRKDRENYKHVMSDTHTIMNEVFTYFNSYNDEGEVYVETPLSPSPINNSLLDYLAGWESNVVFEVPSFGCDNLAL